MRSLTLLLVSALSLPITLSAQLEITTVFATAPYFNFGQFLGPIGDGNGDGIPDFVVHSSIPGTPSGARLQLISGANQAELGQVSGHFETILGIDDIDLDGHRDFLAGNIVTLGAYSGADATPIWTANAFVQYYAACGIGDIDNDSLAEVAACIKANGNFYLVILRGSDGSQMTPLVGVGLPVELASLGDINGDGHHEIVLLMGSSAQVYRTAPISLVSTITPPFNSLRHVEAANIAAGPGNELIISRAQRLFFCDPMTGQILRTEETPDKIFTVVGDLDGDGYDDIAVHDTTHRYGYSADNIISFHSGATGAYLANWAQTPQFRMQVVKGVGDIDGDGFGDLLMGDANASPVGGGGDGAYQLVSGRILATTYSHPVQCHSSPFPPELGMTPPFIGQTATVVGRDGPTNTWGFLAFSPKPLHPNSLGFSGCTAWFDVNSWILVHQQPPAALWTIGLPVPNVPQLAGFNIALQAFYLPTNSPIGIDLSNGIWARIGY
jgi:hypothetical protein